MREGVQIGNVFVEFDDDEQRRRPTAEEHKPKVERRMARIDSLAPEVREIVHEYGWNLVDTFIQHGVTKAKSMKALINSVRTNLIDRADRTP